jgi:hypothetical protein
LRTILQHTGFRLERAHYLNAVGALGWWVQYKLLRRSVHGEGQLGMMNRVLPFVRAAEAILKPPFGLSLVAVCRKAQNGRVAKAAVHRRDCQPIATVANSLFASSDYESMR